jgi:hypothetical protein
VLIGTAIVLAVAVMTVVAVTGPGTSLRTKWELERVRRVEKTATVFLMPGGSIRGGGVGGWTLGALRPVQPVWRYQLVSLHLLPGCEIVLPSGQQLVVAGSAESTTAVAFRSAADAALTVSAAEEDRGRRLVCRRVIVGVPPYDPIATELGRAAEDADKPPTAQFVATGRASFQRTGTGEALVLGIPQRQAEEAFAPAERQYALLQPDTLYIVEDGSSLRPTTLAEVKRLVAAHPEEMVDADLEQRGYGVFVVQLRVRQPR